MKHKEIPQSSQIVAIADVFDALTSKRPYKEPWSVNDAVAEIRKLSGSHFDPKLVAAFTSIIPGIIRIKNKWENAEFSSHS